MCMTGSLAKNSSAKRQGRVTVVVSKTKLGEVHDRARTGEQSIAKKQIG